MFRAKESWAGQAAEGHWFLSDVRSRVDEGVVPQSHGSRALVTHSESFQL